LIYPYQLIPFDRWRVSLLANAGKISFGIDGFGGE